LSSGKKTGKRSAPSSARGGSTLVGIFIGMMLGGCIAAGAAWYFTKTNPFQGDVVAPAPRPSQPRTVTIPSKPGGDPVEKPQLDFYKILPEGNGVAQTKEPVKPQPPQVTVVKPTDKPEEPAETLYLQVGAFESADEAETVKARLAMMGIEAKVQKVQAGNKGTLSRVRIGPFNNPEAMAPVRSQLAQAGMNAGVVRTPR